MVGNKHVYQIGDYENVHVLHSEKKGDFGLTLEYSLGEKRYPSFSLI